LQDQQAQAKESLAKAQAYQKKYDDEKHTAKTYKESLGGTHIADRR
jgi:hypothetical protein